MIHVYHEFIDTETAFLSATFDVEERDLAAAFCVVRDDAKPFSGRLQQHFKTLDLARRFSAEAIDEIAELIEEVGSALEIRGHADLADMVAQHCTLKATARKALYGANHWKVAFYRAAAASHVLVEYLVRRGGRS